MQRPAENLHRATPVPSMDQFAYKRPSAALSVESIPEDGAEAEAEAETETSTSTSSEKVGQTKLLVARLLSAGIDMALPEWRSVKEDHLTPPTAQFQSKETGLPVTFPPLTCRPSRKAGCPR